jgi:predicted DNA-binding ribbon-helix-helix protein
LRSNREAVRRDAKFRPTGREGNPIDGADSVRAGANDREQDQPFDYAALRLRPGRTNLSEQSPYAPPQKRSVLIAGHQTSISLEPIFWHALETAARERGCPVNALVAEIDAARLDSAHVPNLTSAIRQWLFERSLSG